MKNRLFLLFGLFGLVINGQVKKMCFNPNWIEIDCSEKYSFYRLLPDYFEGKETIKVLDYYANGVLQMEGSFLDTSFLKRMGEFKYYNENGTLSLIENYSKSSNLMGDYKKYYPNGKLNYEGFYKTEGGDLIILNFWDEKGNQTIKDGNGSYFSKKEDGSFIKGRLKNCLNVGIWEGYDAEMKLNYTEIYEQNKLIKGTSIDTNNNKFAYTEKYIDFIAIKGINDIRKFLIDRISVPRRLLKISDTLKTTLKIHIDDSGKINQVDVVKPIETNFDEQVVKTVKKYDGGFVPAKKLGKNYKATLVLPITISFE